MQPGRETRVVVTRRGFVQVLATLFVVALVGTLDADEERDVPARTRPGLLTFKVVRSDDGRPVAEAKIGVWMYGEKEKVNREIISDASGVATFEYPNGDRPVYLRALVRRAGLVPYYVNLGHDISAASLPTERTVRLEPGKTIGGKVVDPDGKPVAGAHLSIDVPARETSNRIYYPLLQQQTADDGTWHFDGAPLSLSGLQLQIDHPQFIRSSQQVHDGVDGRYELDRGLTLTGRVLDQNGKPVAGAHVRVGSDRSGRALRPTVVGLDGAYSVAALSPESTFVAVVAPGFAPQVKPIVVAKDTKPVNFELEPGHSTRIRVTDIAGEPLAGIRVVADTWKGFRSHWWESITNADGLVIWTGAPADAVTVHLFRQGYATRRDIVVAPQDEPHVVVLRPPPKVEGIVTGPDKQKVPEFQLQTGRRYDGRYEILWRSEGFGGRDGRFEIEYGELCDEIFIRIEAKGFQTWTSGAIPLTDGSRKLFARLAIGTGPAGIVRHPDGKPASGAQLALVSGQFLVQFQNGFRPLGGKQIVIADEDGRFEFRPVDETYSLIAVHDGGYAEVTDQDLVKAGSVDLQAWAKVEATAQRASKPLAGAKVTIDPQHASRDRMQVISYGLSGTTNDEGRITFDRVPPGTINVTLPLEQSLGRNSRSYTERAATVALTPGSTAQVTVGGTGAIIIGKLAVLGAPPAEHRWEFNEAITISTWRAKNPFNSDASDYYRALIASDGSFRFDDMPPGRYELQVHLTPVPDAKGNDRSVRLGTITREFQVAKDQAEANLGVIEGTWSTQLGVGETAPLFVAEGLNCGTIRLGELRGRLVLLDFWDSTSTAWSNELPELQRLHREFASDTRFQLVGLAMDARIKSARSALEQREVSWNCAFVGSRGLPVLRYDVKVTAEKFLLDVDGKILYRGRDLDAVGKLIRKRLAELPEKIIPPIDPVGIVPTTIDDDFAGSTPIAVAIAGEFIQISQNRFGRRLSSTRAETTMWSEDGTSIRTLKGLGPRLWMARSSQMALDPQRDRWHFCETSKQLIAMNRVGRRLFVSEVPDLHTGAVDERTGDVWCLALRGLGSGELLILDSDGREKTRHPIAGFNIAFSPVDDAFWIAGDGILKVNRVGEILRRHPLPDGATTFAGIAVDRERGGAWVLELRRQNDERRLWKVVPDGSATLAHRFPPQTYPNGLVCLDGAAWLTVFHRDADAPAGTVRGKREIQRLGPDGTLIDSLPIPAVDITVGQQTGSIWVSDGEQIMKIDRDGKTLLAIPLDTKSLGIQLDAF